MGNLRTVRGGRLAVLGLALAMVAGGCGGGGGDDLEIGLKRVGLDLAFRAEEEAAAARRVVLTPTDVPSQAEFAVTAPSDVLTRRDAPPAPAPACQAAPAGAVAESPATVTVLKPPVQGAYAVHRKGTFAIESGQLTIKGAMPAEGEKLYQNVKTVEGNHEFEVVERTGDNFTSRTLRVTPTAIQLIKEVGKLGEATTTFTPTPPVTLMALGTGENASWNSAGVDTATGTAMSVQGRIVKRAFVDLCGTVYDTYVVQSSERVTNVRNGYTSRTNDIDNPPTGGPGLPNIYYVATHYGGLFIQEDFHTTTQFTFGSPPSQVTLRLDYTNTFDSIRPKAS